MLCPTCGNEIDEVAWEEEATECPFCGHALPAASPPSRGRGRLLDTVDLEVDRPTVEMACRRLTQFLSDVRHERTRVVKVIHGYGSTGKGGRIRIAVRKLARRWEQDGSIGGQIPGEEFHRRFPATQALLRRYPEVRGDPDLNRLNRGITLLWWDT